MIEKVQGVQPPLTTSAEEYGVPTGPLPLLQATLIA
jgi:hypothetical protein